MRNAGHHAWRNEMINRNVNRVNNQAYGRMLGRQNFRYAKKAFVKSLQRVGSNHRYRKALDARKRMATRAIPARLGPDINRYIRQFAGPSYWQSNKYRKSRYTKRGYANRLGGRPAWRNPAFNQ